MSWQSWLSFASVSAVILAIPGSVVTLAATYTINLGRSRASVVIPGALLGDIMAMIASFLGVGTVITRFPTVFITLKFAGAGAIILLGYQMFISAVPRNLNCHGEKDASAAQIFWSGFGLSALHPSSFLFFTSFVPQFIDQSRSLLPQFGILLVTFLTIAGITMIIWVLIADRGREILGATRNRRMAKKVSGAFLLCVGIVSVGVAYIE